MIDFGMVMKVKQYWNRFTGNHPKVEPFINQVKAKGFCEGQEIAIAVRYPDGTEFKTGIRVQEGDMDLLNSLRQLG